LDPITYVYPKSWDYQLLNKSLSALLKKKPHLSHLLEHFNIQKKIDLEEIFE
jgi:hypothetical protein